MFTHKLSILILNEELFSLVYNIILREAFFESLRDWLIENYKKILIAGISQLKALA